MHSERTHNCWVRVAGAVELVLHQLWVVADVYFCFAAHCRRHVHGSSRNTKAGIAATVGACTTAATNCRYSKVRCTAQLASAQRLHSAPFLLSAHREGQAPTMVQTHPWLTERLFIKQRKHRIRTSFPL